MKSSPAYRNGCILYRRSRKANNTMQARSHHWALRIAAISALCFSAAVGSSSPALAAKDVCTMLSPNELHSWWGTDLRVSTIVAPIPQSNSCHWEAPGLNDASLIVQIVPARYYPLGEYKGSKGFKMLSGIGEKAFVSTSYFGWTAAAIKGTKAVVVGTMGGKSNGDTAITVLKRLLQQM
jgi:hypothetical protein